MISSLVLPGRSSEIFFKASLIQMLVSDVVGVFVELKMLSPGLILLNAKSTATASVLVPPGKTC